MLKSIILIAILMNIDPIDGMQDVNKLRITRSVSCPNLTNITDMENIITTKPTTHIFYKNKLCNKKNKIMYLRERERNNFNMY
jgi:hypothetical protein